MFCPKCGKDIGNDAFCKYCGAPSSGNRKQHLFIKILIPLICLALIITTFVFLPKIQDMFISTTPTPRPTIRPTPKPTPRPTPYDDFMEYGLTRPFKYNEFVNNYNNNVEWRVSQFSATTIVLTIDATEFDIYDMHDTTDRHQITPNMALSFFLVGYTPLIKQIVLVYDHDDSDDYMDEVVAITGSLIENTALVDYEKVIKQLEIAESIIYKEQNEFILQSDMGYSIYYSIDNRFDSLRFAVSFLNSDTKD